MKIGMVNVRKRLLGNPRTHSMWNTDIRCVNNLHDEVTYEVKTELVEDLVPIIQEELENAFKLRVPLVAEPKIGRTWAECK